MFYVVDGDLEKGKQGQKQIIKQVYDNEDNSFIDAQQYLFENLCSNAIHVKEDVKEIERGIRGNFIETLQNPSEIQKIAMSILDSACYEILGSFSTIDSFYRGEYGGILNSLRQALQRGVMIKMLMQSDDSRLRDMYRK